jgi:hypothetical protein
MNWRSTLLGKTRLRLSNFHCYRFQSLSLMAPVKRQAASSKTRSSSSRAPTLAKIKGENFYRNAKQAARLKMVNGGKPVRDRDGKIIQAAAFQKGEDETKPGRVQPDRKWFGASVLPSPLIRYYQALHRPTTSRQYESDITDCIGPLSNKPFSKEG